jgi:spermidine synthase
MFAFLRNNCEIVLNRVFAAITAGTVTTQLAVGWLSLCGTSPISLMALMVGYTVGVTAACWFGDFLPVHLVRRNRINIQAMVLAICLITLSWLLPELLSASLLAGCETIGTGGSFRAMLALLFPSVIVAIMTTLAGLFFQSITPVAGGVWIRSFLTGGLGVSVAALLCIFSWPLALIPSCTVLGAFAFYTVFRLSTGNTVDAPRVSRGTENNPDWLVPLHFTAVGILSVAVAEIVNHVLMITVPVLIIAAGLTSAAALVLSSASAERLLRVKGMNTIALCLLALLPTFFGVLAETNLQITATSNYPWLMVLFQAAECAILFTAILLPAVFVSRQESRPSGGRTEVLALTLGMAFAIVAVGRGLSPVLALTLGLLLHALGMFFQIRSANSDTVWHLAIKERTFEMRASTLMLLIPLITLLSSFDTVKTSSLMFSPRTQAAIERGVEKELIPQSDANRLMKTAMGSTGEFSVWKRSGNVVEFLRNGVSLGKVSTDTNLSPQPAEEILPAIMALVSHPKPSRVLVLGDDTGACLRSCSHFPVQEIVAVRSDAKLTDLAQEFTWGGQDIPVDKDERVRILHVPQIVALKDRSLKSFDVVVASADAAQRLSGVSLFTVEFYSAVRSRMNSESVFCQRFRQHELGPEPVKQTMATMLQVFSHVGAVQTVPGEILLFATDSSKGLIDPEILARLQREHVQQEIASTGWDWSQVAVLPLVDARDPIGIFSHERPPKAISISHGGFALQLPFNTAKAGSRSEDLRLAFAPHQIQLIAKTPTGDDHAEVQRRLSALTQQLEILAGMPDQPWTYRKSLRMEMQRSPRPPQEIIQAGHVVKTSHPLDVFSRDYFLALGRALSAVTQHLPANDKIAEMERFTDNPEPLLSHFAHYEIVRLHELANHPDPANEFQHRLHTVFFTTSTDASVRPVIAAIEQLVRQPELVHAEADRYDMLNALVQKLIERWEARTTWEPKSAVRVQHDVDESIRVTNLALDLMEQHAAAANVNQSDFLCRRRYIHAALTGPLRDYRDQVLSHRIKSEKPAENSSEDPNDMPLLLNPDGDLSTN